MSRIELNPNNISNTLKKEIENFEITSQMRETGRVTTVGDGIVQVEGLYDTMSGELLKFESGVSGIAMNLQTDTIGVILLGDDDDVAEGNLVIRTRKIVQIPVGDAFLGRVVNALGEPIDGNERIMTYSFRPVEHIAPGVISRDQVTEPLETGIKAIDTMVPIGKGQRQLLIGDRQTGKTAIAIDTIINQKGKNVNCIYVSIGQKTSSIANIISTLTENGAMSYTTIVTAGASDPVSLQYLAPYAGCALGEEWMSKGKDVLIVFDDLSKHAVAYRTMSLLLRRPSGREAYPGDVFYLHSRLLERAGKLSSALGGGSMTALPIIETLGGDMSAYIPTNVISITDGQIYLESDLFNSGIRPAINPGLSVSRVGGSAQIPAMKKISGPIRTELAQYRELEAFSQFSSSLDNDTLDRLEHGKRIVEILKQPQYYPMPIEHQILILFAITRKMLSGISIENISDCESSLIEYMSDWHYGIMLQLKKEKHISPELDQRITKAINEFLIEYNS